MKIFRILVLLGLLLGAGLVLLAVQVVRTEDGYLIRKKEHIGLGEYVVDLRNQDLFDRIQQKVKEVDWQQIEKKASRAWRNLSGRFDELSKEMESTSIREEARKEWDALGRELNDRYRKLERKLENRSINFEQFEKEMERLGTWFEQQSERFQI